MKTSTVNVGAIVVGLLFIAIGAVLAADAYFAWDIEDALLWSGLLIAAGVLVAIPRGTSGE